MRLTFQSKVELRGGFLCWSHRKLIGLNLLIHVALSWWCLDLTFVWFENFLTQKFTQQLWKWWKSESENLLNKFVHSFCGLFKFMTSVLIGTKLENVFTKLFYSCWWQIDIIVKFYLQTFWGAHWTARIIW